MRVASALTWGALTGSTALALACDDPGGTTTTTSPNTSLSFSNGAQVNRFDESPFFFANFRQNLVFTVGLVTPIEEFCADPENAVLDGVAHIKEVLTKKDRLLGRWVSDRATLVVYGNIPEGPCLLTEDDVIARGTGKFVLNDNFPIPTGKGTFGYRVTGTVELANGGRAHFHAIIRVVFPKGGEGRLVVDKVELKPIGN
jgi:hypothetical protein